MFRTCLCLWSEVYTYNHIQHEVIVYGINAFILDIVKDSKALFHNANTQAVFTITNC